MNGDATETSRHFLFIVASARIAGALGNTEWLARAAARHLPAGATSAWLHLNALDLADFDDRRHDVGTYPMPAGDTLRMLDATLEATDLVFVTPLYWYSFPNRLKRYLDHWSAWMRVDGLPFKERMKGKRVWAITTSGTARRRSRCSTAWRCAPNSWRWPGSRRCGARAGRRGPSRRTRRRSRPRRTISVHRTRFRVLPERAHPLK